MREGVSYAKKFLKDINIIAEVGVQDGSNAVSIWNALHPKEMFLVDSYNIDTWTK